LYTVYEGLANFKNKAVFSDTVKTTFKLGNTLNIVASHNYW